MLLARKLAWLLARRLSWLLARRLCTGEQTLLTGEETVLTGGFDSQPLLLASVASCRADSLASCPADSLADVDLHVLKAQWMWMC